MTITDRLAGFLLVVFVLVASGIAHAQAFPSKPIRLLVGFPPGSSLDAAARAVSGRLTDLLGQPVIVDNRAGAGGNIAAEIVARARPDGHTVLVGASGALAINPSLYGNLPYDPVRDFAPVGLLVRVTNVLVLHPSAPAQSVGELIALANGRGW